jgi:hypothetical protein
MGTVRLTEQVERCCRLAAQATDKHLAEVLFNLVREYEADIAKMTAKPASEAGIIQPVYAALPSPIPAPAPILLR